MRDASPLIYIRGQRSWIYSQIKNTSCPTFGSTDSLILVDVMRCRGSWLPSSCRSLFMRLMRRCENPALDKSTTEIFVLAWFRFNKFPPGPRRRILDIDLARIESSVLRATVEKSISCIPKESKVKKVNIAVEARPGESMAEFLARKKEVNVNRRMYV